MFVVEDKKGGKAVRLSRQEQGLLAYSNILSIQVQKMREMRLPTPEILEADVKLAAAERSLEEILNRET